ncbi:MAG: DNA primase small subunit domain-containing protein [Candidatus Ranarchaeia archaeon]
MSVDRINRIIIPFFREYYSKNFQEIEFPNKMRNREFGFFQFRKGIVIRHISFSSEKEAEKYIVNNIPQHIYYSTAYFDDPSAERMKDKIWKGSDLIFDIDADHFFTSCREEHDSWICKKCGNRGKGIKPVACSKCGSIQFQESTWMCENCLDVAKDQVFKLVDDFLLNDFGISKNEIKIVFSGHRGYHVHVISDLLSEMSASARREIVDYVIGRGINFEKLGLMKTKGSRFVGPSLKEDGWKGRLVKSLCKYINEVELGELEKLDDWTTQKAKKLLRNKESIINKLSSSSPTYESISGIGYEQWVSLSKASIMDYGVKIDEPVTGDIHRLIRLPGSLHGKTGLKTQIIKYKDLEAYDPFRNPVAFGGELDIHVTNSPKFRMGDIEYEPMKNQWVKLDKAAGIYLLAKRAADNIKI